MFRIIVSLLIGAVLSLPTAFAQPDTLWTKILGGNDWDEGHSVQQTSDGGYIIAGLTYSYGAGSADIYLIKTDANGNEQWSQTFGGSYYDEGNSVQQTSDGGYIITGGSAADIYLIKTDSSGAVEWSQTFGESQYSDCGKCVQQTTDGGYVITGYIDGEYDAYFICLIKTDDCGNEQWIRRLGSYMGYCVQQTSDAGYIVIGTTYSPNPPENLDICLVKTDSSGYQQWSQIFGESGMDRGYSGQQTVDGGYIVTGTGGYLIKTDTFGNEQWIQYLSATGYSVKQTNDGGYIITGVDYSGYDANVSLIKTDNSGNVQWSQTFGGTDSDYGYSVQQTTEGGYIIAGYTASFGAGDRDVYLIRLEPETAYPDVTISIDPLNPPIIIPATGGAFEYELVLENLTTQPQTVDVWIDVTLPNGTVYGPLALRTGFEMPPGCSLTRTLSQYVPLPAPEGQYTMNAYVGDYDLNEVWCEDHFTFMKVCDGGESIDYLPEPEGFNSTASEVTITYQQGEAEINNHPNPFNLTTTISFTLPVACSVQLAAYDLSGRKIADLVDGWRDAGMHEVTFDGSKLPSGVYLYRIKADVISASGKMVLMK